MGKWLRKKYRCLLIVVIVMSGCAACAEEKTLPNGNDFFFKEDEIVHTYEGYFYLHSYTDLCQDVDLSITRLEDFSEGTLYALELEQPESSDPFDELYGHKYIGYFYVTEKAVYYYKDSITNEDGYIDENNNRIIQWIRNDEADFLKKSTIVCCEEGTEDITDENGYHAYVEAEGDKRIFRSYNDYFYGSKDYMLMVWEKGIGLTYYMHGSGGMDMHVEFGHNLKEEQKTDYGYPFKLFHEANNATDEQEEQSDFVDFLWDSPNKY